MRHFPEFCSSCWEIPKPNSHSEPRHTSEKRGGGRTHIHTSTQFFLKLHWICLIVWKCNGDNRFKKLSDFAVGSAKKHTGTVLVDGSD